MAREEADRENLLQDATAYRRRIQWQLPAWDEPVFAGFRADGAASFYFGPDPVYHFNAGGELRRLFLQGCLLKAEGGALVRMQRLRTAGQVELRSQVLSAAEQEAICQEVSAQLLKLSAELKAGKAQLQGQVPEDAGVEALVLQWLTSHDSIRIAESAGV